MDTNFSEEPILTNDGTEPDSARHPLDQLVVDPTGKPPMCDADTFVQVMQAMAESLAPRRFAVMQEYGERVDMRCAGWGLAFDDHVEIISQDGTARWRGPTAEGALIGFGFGTHISPHLVWLDQEAPEDPMDD